MTNTEQLIQAASERGLSFGKDSARYLEQYADAPDRELFYYLINSDEFRSVGPRAQQLVQQQLEQAQALAENESTPDYLRAFAYSKEAFAQRLVALQSIEADFSVNQPINPEQLSYALQQYAPSALIDGCWLQNISIAPNNHTDVATQLFHIYTDKIGDGETAKHHGNLYRGLLNSAHVQMPDVNSRLFSLNREVQDHAFHAPVFQLALSLFPRVRLPELIGYTLGNALNPPNQWLTTLCDQLTQQGVDARYHQLCLSGDMQTQHIDLAKQTVQTYLDGLPDEAQRAQHWQRIWNGLVAHAITTQPWLLDVHDALNTPRELTPHQKMVAMLHDKAPHARNMHRKRKLDGQLMNHWFDQEPFDAEGFMAALAASPYVNLKEPEKSALITRSVNFGGPMFRIFTDQEHAIMSDWIHSLAEKATDGEVSIDETKESPENLAKLGLQTSFTPESIDDSADLATYAKCTNRELYYYFVNADIYPDILPTARKTALDFFAKAKKEMSSRKLPEYLRLFPYSHDRFEKRVRHIYDMEASAYKPLEGPSPVPREAMVWFTQQYAPFPMVDGSWVQHTARAGMSHTEISARLFRIYSDEVGNADVVKNHPNVYRQMLEDEGIDLPATDSMDFAQQPNLRNFAFDLPLLTMSISMFPKSFMPEIIGVNLAIELSGLGKEYMDIIDQLRFWKIDPYFFVLHLTIDNIASGHTAVAMETVHLYLDQVLSTQGQEAMQREWERVWIGYLAFRQNMTRFNKSLENEAQLRFLLPFIRLSLQNWRKKKQKSSAKK